MLLPKYAKLEIERRFLMAPQLAADLRGEPFRRIEDLYIDGGRLRLRSITDTASGEREFKLCKKYPGGDALAGPVTNLYLTQDEYASFAVLPGAPLSKRRHKRAGFSMDVFEGALTGLVLAEVEVPDREAALALQPPADCIREVTDEPLFTGGSLCRMDASALQAALV